MTQIQFLLLLSYPLQTQSPWFYSRRHAFLNRIRSHPDHNRCWSGWRGIPPSRHPNHSWQDDCIHDIEKKERCTCKEALIGLSMQAHFLITFFCSDNAVRHHTNFPAQTSDSLSPGLRELFARIFPQNDRRSPKTKQCTCTLLPSIFNPSYVYRCFAYVV